MALTLADLLRDHWPGYARAHRSHLVAAHYWAVRSVLACRTPELGGRLYHCGDCNKSHFAYHSCNHRSCPQCGALDQQKWTAKQEAKLLPVHYFLVTFTVPSELRGVCLAHPKALYSLLLTESAGALRDVIATKTKGGCGGCVSVLHTWGRQMQHHPHVHSIVPAVALDPEGDQLIHPAKASFLVHYLPLAARFRSRLQQALENEHPEIYAQLSAEARRSLQATTLWNVHLQPAGNGRTALRYLARYVHRSAFSPGRLLGLDDRGQVMLRWTSSATGQTGVLRLHPHEFIRRWLLHVLPKGLTRIRHYGWLSPAAVKTRRRVRWLLGAPAEPEPTLPEEEAFCCDHCGGTLTFVRQIKRLYPQRGPPSQA